MSERIAFLASWATGVLAVAVVHAGIAWALLTRWGSIRTLCRWLEIRSGIDTAADDLLEGITQNILQAGRSNFAAVARTFARQNAILDRRIRRVHSAFYAFIVCEGAALVAGALNFANISGLTVGMFVLLAVVAFGVELLTGLTTFVEELKSGPAAEEVRAADEAAKSLLQKQAQFAEDDGSSFSRQSRRRVWLWSAVDGWEVECTFNGAVCILLSPHEYTGDASVGATIDRGEPDMECLGRITNQGKTKGRYQHLFVPEKPEQLLLVMRSARVTSERQIAERG